MKLLYVHNADLSIPNANKVQVVNMCEAFGEEINTTLLAIGKKNIDVYKYYNLKKNFELILLKNLGSYMQRTLRMFSKFSRIQKKYDVIYSRDLLFCYLSKTRFKNKKIFYELHDYSHKSMWSLLFRITFPLLDHLIVISEGLKQDLVKKGFSANKITVLHDGVNLKKFNSLESKDDARKKLNLPNKKIVTYVGSFQKWKGFMTAIESSKYLGDDFLILLVGATEPKEKKLETNNVKIVNFVDNKKVLSYLKASDVLIITNEKGTQISEKYTSPLKLFEYMASKRPIIASDLTSIRKIVNKDEVMFFKAGDAQNLAEKIKVLLSKKKLQDTLEKNSFNKVKNFTWEKRAKKIVSMLK